MLGPGDGARRRHDEAAEFWPRLTLTTRGDLETKAHASPPAKRGDQEALAGFHLHCQRQSPSLGDARPRTQADVVVPGDQP